MTAQHAMYVTDDTHRHKCQRHRHLSVSSILERCEGQLAPEHRLHVLQYDK